MICLAQPGGAPLGGWRSMGTEAIRLQASDRGLRDNMAPRMRDLEPLSQFSQRLCTAEAR